MALPELRADAIADPLFLILPQRKPHLISQGCRLDAADAPALARMRLDLRRGWCDAIDPGQFPVFGRVERNTQCIPSGVRRRAERSPPTKVVKETTADLRNGQSVANPALQHQRDTQPNIAFLACAIT